MQHEIKRPGPLLNPNGTLREPGYSVTPQLDYDRAQVKASKHRLKEWDYYLIFNRHAAVALTLADNAYMGLVSASVIDFDAPDAYTRSMMTLFPMGKFGLPASSESGDCEFASKDMRLSFKSSAKRRELTFDMSRFRDGKPIQLELELTDLPQHSMSIATPFQGKPRHFYYNRKIIGMRAEGSVLLGDKELTFEPEDSLGLLDWGRGVWPYSGTWYWSAAMGWQDDINIGFNLGYGFGDTSAASENMLFINGVAHKLGRVDFGIPVDSRGKHSFMTKWHVTDDAGRLDLTFTPIIDRASCTNALLIVSDQHQVFGRFDGTLTLDDGSKLEVKDMPGFAEKVHNRW